MYRVFVEHDGGWEPIHHHIHGSIVHWAHEPTVGSQFMFKYADPEEDDTWAVVRTSVVENVMYSTHGTIIVCTKNSIYTLEEVHDASTDSL